MNLADITKLFVRYNGRNVGILAELADRRIAFQYDERWVAEGFSISPFSLPLGDRVFISGSRHFDGLYGVFHDALPDGWGELLVRRYLRSKAIEFDRLSPLVRLSLVGQNGLGGLSFEPSRAVRGESEWSDLDRLASDIRALLAEKDGAVDLDRLVRMGGSSGGARPKAHLRIDGEDWIVKFPSSIDSADIGLAEFETNELAERAGIHVNEHALFPSATCPGYFGAKRFDRRRESRIHMVSLSSLLETSHRIPNLDYVHLFQVAQQICVDRTDVEEAYRRMCFNVLIGNKDDHGKNHSFLYDEERGGYRLSPAYDLTRTPDKVEHEMTVNGKGNPTDVDLTAIAETMKFSVKRCADILNQTKDAVMSGIGRRRE
ncbi:MAG: type II toxin-antitoxin system HipA family toxin [Candidatus Izemoplasmatales bacterium]